MTATMVNLKGLARKNYSGPCPNCHIYVSTYSGKYGPYLMEMSQAYDNGARYKRGAHRLETCERRFDQEHGSPEERAEQAHQAYYFAEAQYRQTAFDDYGYIADDDH